MKPEEKQIREEEIAVFISVLDRPWKRACD